MTLNTSKRMSVAMALAMVVAAASTALAGPLPRKTVERMMAATTVRITQLNLRLARIDAMMDAEDKAMTTFAEKAQKEGMSVDEYNDRLGDYFQRVAELAADRTGTEATRASLIGHMESLKIQLAANLESTGGPGPQIEPVAIAPKLKIGGNVLLPVGVLSTATTAIPEEVRSFEGDLIVAIEVPLD